MLSQEVVFELSPTLKLKMNYIDSSSVLALYLVEIQTLYLFVDRDHFGLGVGVELGPPTQLAVVWLHDEGSIDSDEVCADHHG